MRLFIPSHTIDGIEEYVTKGTPCGDFLTAALANDFVHAAQQADDFNGPALQAIGQYISWYLPMGCYGSLEKVKKWTEMEDEERKAIVDACIAWDRRPK